MDWQALLLSLQLAAVTLALLLPFGVWLGRWLANTRMRGKGWVDLKPSRGDRAADVPPPAPDPRQYRPY